MRELDRSTLGRAAKFYAVRFFENRGRQNQDWVMGQLHDATFADEHDFLVALVRENLGRDARKEFDAAAAARFTPRDTAVFEALLRDKLAIDKRGNHLPGVIGSTVQHGFRHVGSRLVEVERLESILYRRLMPDAPRLVEQREVPEYWPIYAGEPQERADGNKHGAADELPPGHRGLPVGAEVTRIGIQTAIDMCNAAVDKLDEGSGAAIARGFTGAQPGDPDDAATGTLLHTNPYSATAFGNAVDNTGKATATANTIGKDLSADATGTVGYVRCSSSNNGSTPLDDHIDGNAALTDAAFVYSNTAIVAGGEVDITSHLANVSQT